MILKMLSRSGENTKAMARLFLSEGQQNVLNIVIRYKKGVFVTASAGTSEVTTQSMLADISRS